jgi:hypothetical protein
MVEDMTGRLKGEGLGLHEKGSPGQVHVERYG